MVSFPMKTHYGTFTIALAVVASAFILMNGFRTRNRFQEAVRVTGLGSKNFNADHFLFINLQTNLILFHLCHILFCKNINANGLKNPDYISAHIISSLIAKSKSQLYINAVTYVRL